MKYVLVQDESSHWYVIPADKQDEFEQAVYDEEEIPAFAQQIGGHPSLVQFENWEIA